MFNLIKDLLKDNDHVLVTFTNGQSREIKKIDQLPDNTNIFKSTDTADYKVYFREASIVTIVPEAKPTQIDPLI
ncbi:MAG: hypothetical protein ABF703_07865 [Oenococcus sp.]|uniref:hypothetical protein n=1 Tax=Oenococcus TaxID=46254 RepID=UPI0021E8DDBD|nr:hypothetical protein [Oenococcus kitaharae]MCV3295530.1 hypothetical protein [Oenococcus kitaharae]